MSGFAWVTLATNDSYSLGALVLAHSLRQTGTTHQLAVLVTPGVTKAMRDKLASVFSVVQEVNVLDSKDEANLRLLKRPELGITFTKLHCWRLTQFDKCVFLDADTLVLKNVDELFERDELSAAPDVGWPDCFNSGVFVYRPSNETYEKLIAFALEKGSFDGGDQGLLNLYFSDWAHKDINKHLPFIYNMCSTACYSYLPAFKQYGTDVKIVHFIGASKPWLQYFNTESKQVQPSTDMQHLKSVLQVWWDIFCTLIHPNLSSEMSWSRISSESSNLLERPGFSFDLAPDYRDVWDPWEEYDNKPELESSSVHSLESHTANAHCNNVPAISSISSYTPPSSPSSSHSLPAQLHAYIPPCLSPIANSPICVSPCDSPVHSICNDSEDSELPVEYAATSIVTKENSLDSDNDDGGLAGAFAQFTLGSPRSPTQDALEDHLRRQGWEVGNIDYMGRDSFDNIWSKICETLAAAPQPEKEATPVPEKQPTTEKVEPPTEVTSLTEATDAAKANESIAEIIIAQLTEPVELVPAAAADAPPQDVAIADPAQVSKEEGVIAEAAKTTELVADEAAKIETPAAVVETSTEAPITGTLPKPIESSKIETPAEVTEAPKVELAVEAAKLETPVEAPKAELPTTTEAAAKIESPAEVAVIQAPVDSPKGEQSAPKVEAPAETPKEEAPAKIEQAVESPKAESAVVEATKIEEAKIEEQPKVEAPKTETVVEAPKTEIIVEATKVATPTEPQKVESAAGVTPIVCPKVEETAVPPKVDAAKPDEAKDESPKVEAVSDLPKTEVTPKVEATAETVQCPKDATDVIAAETAIKPEVVAAEVIPEQVPSKPEAVAVATEATPVTTVDLVSQIQAETPVAAESITEVESAPKPKDEPEGIIKAETAPIEATKVEAPKDEVKAEAPKEDVHVEIPKEEVKAEVPKDEVKVEAPKEEAKVEAPKEEVKAEAPKEEVQVEAPKEEVKVEAPKEEGKVEAPKEEVKVEAPKEEVKLEAPKEEVKVEAPKEEVKVEAPKEEVKAEAPKEEVKSEETKVESLKAETPKEEVKEQAVRQKSAEPKEVAAVQSDPAPPVEPKPQEIAAAAECVKTEPCAECPKEEKCAECPKQSTPEGDVVIRKKCQKKKGAKECPKQDCEKKEASKSPTPEVAEVATEEQTSTAATSGGQQAPTPPPRKSSGAKKTKPKK